MSDKKKLFDWLDEEIRSCDPAMKYARENIEDIIDSAYRNCVSKTYTTRGYDLGIACPSLINHRVIGGNKKGRVIKSIPEKDAYCEIGYNSNKEPLYFKSVNKFRTEETYFFFHYNGAVWAMEMEHRYDELKRFVSDFKMKKYYYDEQGRIKFYGELKNAGFADVNLYEYPENVENPIICHFYYYITHLSEQPDAETGIREGTRFTEYMYEITSDMKTITEYRKNADDEYIFSRKIVSGGKKSSKPKAAADSFQSFSEWLDSEIEKEIPDKGGVYFDLFSPTEDGFGIYFCITERFDPDDEEWACEPAYSSDNMHMVSTSGELEWEAALSIAVKLIKKYMREGKYKSILRKYDGIGTSFADAEIEYIKY